MNNVVSQSLGDFIANGKFRLTREDQGPAIIASSVEVSLDALAATINSMRLKRAVFSHRHGVEVEYSDDLNGSGMQLISLSGMLDGSAWTANLTFWPIRGENETFCYEADLITDQRKDYEPTVNHGKHKFRPDRFMLSLSDPKQIEKWFMFKIPAWKHEIDRLSAPHSTLKEWISSNLYMTVHCKSLGCWRGWIVLTIYQLKQYDERGMTLDDLRKNLKCSKCGSPMPEIRPF